MPNIRPLCPELQVKAAVELFEVPQRIQSDIEALRDWIKKSPHLRARTDDQFLVSFLRGSKYSLERAKFKLDMYYTIRTHIPEIFMNRDPTDQKMRAIIRMGVGLPLPIVDAPDSPRILLIRPGTYDPNVFSIQEVMKVSAIVQDICLWEDDNLIVAGQVGILDLANVGTSHFLQFNPTFIKKMTMMGQEASPTRQKGFHYVNVPYGFEQVFNMFKTFMNEKNKSRLHVHGSNLESLYQHVPKRLLPEEYGGEAGAIQKIIDYWEQKILTYRDLIIEEETYGIDESKRIGRAKNAEDLFGVEGSFRQLEFD